MTRFIGLGIVNRKTGEPEGAGDPFPLPTQLAILLLTPAVHAMYIVTAFNNFFSSSTMLEQ